MKIGAVILAAGFSARMGQQKLLLPLAGKPLLSHVLAAVVGFAAADAVAVIGEPQAELERLCMTSGIRSVYNAQRHNGQASSVKLGLAHLDGSLDGVIFLPGDQPLITKELLQKLADRFSYCKDSKCMIVPAYKGEYGSPVLFGSYWFEALRALEGDRGGRSLVRRWPEHVRCVEWSDEKIFWDADTPADYERLLTQGRGKDHGQYSD